MSPSPFSVPCGPTGVSATAGWGLGLHPTSSDPGERPEEAEAVGVLAGLEHGVAVDPPALREQTRLRQRGCPPCAGNWMGLWRPWCQHPASWEAS